MAHLAFRTEELRYDDVQITVRAASLRSELEKRDLNTRLSEKISFGADYLFSYLEAVVQTDTANGIGFSLPSPSSSDETHMAAFEQFINLPSLLITEWFEACQRVNTPPNTTRELQPGVESKDPKSESVAANS